MNMKRLLLFLAALLCCIVLANAQEKYRVTANFPVKIWSSASDNRVAIGSLNPNTPVDVYGKTGDWLKIKYNGNKYGYVFHTSLTKIKPPVQEKTAQAKKAPAKVEKKTVQVNKQQTQTAKKPTQTAKKPVQVEKKTVQANKQQTQAAKKPAQVKKKPEQTKDSTVQVEKKKEKKPFWENIDMEKYATHNVPWLIFIIFGLSIVLWYIRTRIRYDDDTLSGVGYVINLVLFIITCVLEGVYLVMMGDETVWFCMPDEVGWIGAAIGFIGLGWLVYNQFFCFFDVMTDIRYHAGDFDMRLGIYTWPVAIIAGLIASFAEWNDAYVWIISILILCQVVQIGIIIAGVAPYGGGAYSALAIFVYLIGVLTTLIFLLQFIALLIVVLIVGFFIMAFAKGSLSSSGSSSSSSDSSSSGSSDDGHGYLYPQNSLGSIEGRFLNDDTFHEYGGGYYDKQADGSWKKR